jgi:hypothetical protein
MNLAAMFERVSICSLTDFVQAQLPQRLLA